MNRWLILTAAVLSIIGLGINLGVDFDNVYDMTLTGLWGLTFIVLILGLFLGGGWKATVSSRGGITQPQSGSTVNQSKKA